MTTYKWKTKPYKHQVLAVKKALRIRNIALLMEPRTGKTKAAIDYLSILSMQQKIDRAVIICPARVIDVWVQEFHKHCPLLYALHVWDKNARANPIPPVQSVYQLSILLVNYEAFATPGRKLASGRRSKASGRFAFRKQIQKWTSYGIGAAGVLDESHKIKSPSGKAANMIVSMRSYFDYRVIMTGTPVTKTKRVFDIYMQWKFLNPRRFSDIANSDDFKNSYGVWTNRNGYPQFLRSKNTIQLKQRIHQDSYAIKRSECFDLPRKTTRKILIPLNESGPIYDELAEEMVARFERKLKEHKVEATIPLTLTLRLSQITGGFTKTTEGETIETGYEKIKVFERLLDEAIENDEKMVVAARFRPHLDAVIDLAKSKGVKSYAVRGGLSRQEVTQNIARFNRTDGIAICAMNPAAGGLGIDLSTAAHMVWYSLTPSWVDFSQSCDRIALSPNPTTFTYLLAKNTVDTMLYDVLKNDGDVAKAIIDNPRKVLRNG